MRSLPVLALLPFLLAAEEHWVKFTSGPFEIYTDAGTRAARQDLVRLEEFRHALGDILGEPDLQLHEPLQVLVFKNAKGWDTATPVVQSRTGYAAVLDEKVSPGGPLFSELTRLFLDANTGRMPADFERGLIEFFSTLDVNGIRITAGASPPHPDLAWARIHLLVTNPEYYGKLRVLLYNLRKGVDSDPAYRNAFGKPAAEIEAQAKQHLAAGNFTIASLNSRPLSEHDFVERPVSDADARLLRADLLNPTQSVAEYQTLLRDHLKVPEAEEGLGLLALGRHDQQEAKRHFAAAITAGSSSARCYIEYAKLEQDNEKATQALLKAAGINPKLDEPFALLAARDTDPARRVAHWKAAAERNSRNSGYWKAVAEGYLALHNFSEAAKAWDQAAQAATDPAEKQRIIQARLAIEGQRLDYEAAQRAQESAEIEKLKAEARAEVHALEKKYAEPNATGAAPSGAGQKPVPWWSGPQPSGKVSGLLKQVDCIGSQARLVVEGDDHRLVKLLIADPGKVAIIGGGEQTLGCGAQKPRHVKIEYFPKSNPRLAILGEVATLEFQ